MPQVLSRIEVIEKAARLVRDGDLNPALQSYKQLFAQDPEDWAVANALGDLYLRMGRAEEGITHFMDLAERVARDGYTTKARALYRKILRVQPDNELAGYRVVELENQHLVETSPFMQRMRDTARNSRAAAIKQQADAESSTNPDAVPAPAAQPKVAEQQAAEQAAPQEEPPKQEAPGEETPFEEPRREEVSTIAPSEAEPVAAEPPSASPDPLAEPEPESPAETIEIELALESPETTEEPEAAVAEEISEEAVAFEEIPDEWDAINLDAAAAPRAVDLPSFVLVTEGDDEEPDCARVEEAAAPAAEEHEEVISLEMATDEWSSINLQPVAAPRAVEFPSFVVVADDEDAEPEPVQSEDTADREETDASAVEIEDLPDDWISMNFKTATLLRAEDPESGSDDAHEREDAREFRKSEKQARRAAAKGDFHSAATTLERFLEDRPHHVPALEALIDVGVEGRFEQLASLQARLAEACLATGRLAQARNVAVDLLSRDPDDPRCHDVLDRLSGLVDGGPASAPAAAALMDRVAEESGERPRSIHMRLILEALGPEEPIDIALSPAGTSQDSFDEIRIALLEDVTAAAEERLAAANRLIEAGNFQEALGFLEEAICVPHLRHSGGARLARAYRESGDCLNALDCLEWAAERPPVSEESGHSLAYELALTLEAMGERQQALGVYQELLSAVGPAFRDVAARADRLVAA
jgi:tetratricopeptide (TPR) repeat protein